MTASYSASLLEAWNPNLSAYSMSIPSGEVRIKPAPLPCAFEAPSTESFHIGRSSSERVGSASSIGANSMTKSARTCPFIAVLGLYLMSNSLSSMAHFAFRRLPVCARPASLNTLLGLLWCEPGNRDEASELQSPAPVLIFPFSGTSPPLLSELYCNSKLGAVLALCL